MPTVKHALIAANIDQQKYSKNVSIEQKE